ncbi:MAG TPA: hypothetical protein VHT73_02055 [Thermodesulfobacteriota bacterium]|nr:hypothetical protein [Thermodesulfobacteriota bacterium]
MHILKTPLWAHNSVRGSFGHNLHDRWGGRFDPHESRMYAIHSTKVAFWICIKDLQAGIAPCASEVNPEATAICECISDPVGAEAILHDDNNVTAIVEIPHGNTAPFARPMADCFNDKRVSPGVRRPRDAGQKGEVSDLIRDTDDPLRKVHLTAPWTPN